MQLALGLPPAIARRANVLRGIVCFDTEAEAEAFLERRDHGDLYTGKPATMRLKPHRTDGGWVLCAYWSGHPYCLGTDKVMRRVNHVDV